MQRRSFLKMSSVVGSSLVLRSLASGIPMSALMGAIPTDEVLAQAEDSKTPQFLIMNLSQAGDPFNASCPGVYNTGLEGVLHNQQATMAPTDFTLGSNTVTAAKPWADLQAAQGYAVNRMAFIHHSTRTNIHPQFGAVMSLMGNSRGAQGENIAEFLPSMLSQSLAAQMETIQAQPLNLSGPRVDYEGQTLNQTQPNTLGDLFPTYSSVEHSLRTLRDTDLLKMHNALKVTGSRKQKAWLESQATALEELRQLDEVLVQGFSDITENTPEAAIEAAIIAFKLNITPVATMGVGFGGDNHNDVGLADEAEQHVSGLEVFATLFRRLQEENMQDQVTFANLGVFGRTLSDRKQGNGRDHNLNHHVMMMSGQYVNAGVYGGIKPVGTDFGATGIESTTGTSNDGGDIPVDESLESAAKTLAAAVGLPSGVMETRVQSNASGQEAPVGKIISAAVG